MKKLMNEHKCTSHKRTNYKCLFFFALLLLCSCALMLLFAGCTENKYVLTTDRLCTRAASPRGERAASKQAVFAIAEKTLSEMHFAVEKSDAEAGLLRTYPLSGAQSFELWRSDSVGSFNQAEADIHSIRRTVEINVADLSRRSAAKTEQPSEICVNCIATAQRLRLGGDEQVYATPVEIRRSVQKLGDSRKQKTNITWTDLGRDGQLETEIIKRIGKALAAPQPAQRAAQKESTK